MDEKIAEGVETPEIDPNTVNLLKQAGAHWVIAISAFALWAALDSWWLVSQLGLAAVLSVVGALIFGVVISHVAHEWGHYAGLRLAGCSPPIKDSVAPLFFDFDYEKGSQKQFLWMSVGGAIGNWALVILFFIVLPFDTAARVALWATFAGMTAFVAVLEYPVIGSAWRGEDALSALTRAFTRPDVFRNAAVVAFITFVFQPGQHIEHLADHFHFENDFQLVLAGMIDERRQLSRG